MNIVWKSTQSDLPGNFNPTAPPSQGYTDYDGVV